jgi:hypothetical protein
MIEVVNKKTYNKHDATYVGRGSPLGNPYSHRPSVAAVVKVKSREEAIKRYRVWLEHQIDEPGHARMFFLDLVKFYKDFGTLKLACWCAPKACHAEVIAEMVEKYARQTRNESEEQGEAVEAEDGSQNVPEQVMA